MKCVHLFYDQTIGQYAHRKIKKNKTQAHPDLKIDCVCTILGDFYTLLYHL